MQAAEIYLHVFKAVEVNENVVLCDLGLLTNDHKNTYSTFLTCFFSPFVSLSAQYLSFRSEPTSLVQSHGSVARLRCSASPPSAAISWRFRGLPLDPDTLPGMEMNGGSLTISSLKPIHTGVYHCVARLDHGPSIASRHARVAIAGTDVENYPFVHTSAHFKATGERKKGSCFEKRKAIL